ncbi:ribosome-associated ATPase/putative transporter RbbA [Thiohalomonas denitrificans]|uniref:Ribosome-dependent ATPase n=1 Tax=Thiohalomonas denitrificans TaxID=415747 RepID=A0A1G5QN98_9GAMM|nr:ribosome-associated ATPase/putative transporter RbbA [Thiohalomonas denitrificans]SCZ63126.1 ribosome-dependent ATPase [Thiohalomonas denitrificans]
MGEAVGARNLSHRYRGTAALADLDLSIPAGSLMGVIGPDGVGKSTLLSLIAGARKLQEGTLRVLNGDIRSRTHRTAIQSRVAYMPQGLGRNLYLNLSIFENIDFFGRLFGQGRVERQWRIEELLAATGLSPFRDRPAGKLSGGMKQKLGLCCALIHDPDLLILDEPTTGFDPLSRHQFWELIAELRTRRRGMTILVATASLEEARALEQVVVMDSGRILAEGRLNELMAQTAAESLDELFIRLLPEERRKTHKVLSMPDRWCRPGAPAAIAAEGLTRRFGDFTAVDHVSFNIGCGEIFGFLGSNGCGKTTTMKMLTGLLPLTEGKAWLYDKPVDASDIENRRHIGYMSQDFSLYRELTVRQNLTMHARLFHLPTEQIPSRVEQLVERFELSPYLDKFAGSLPMGIRQRLSLAVAIIHRPEILILDEPTSGVDPMARDSFWELLLDLSRNQGVTIFVSTHFMDEAARCDRISLMHAGRVLAIGSPDELKREKDATTLEEAFVGYLKEAAPEAGPIPETKTKAATANAVARPKTGTSVLARLFDIRRTYAYGRREALELLRDPVRLVFALFGTVVLMIAFGYGISLDVEDLPFAVLDQDRTPESRAYIENISSSRYFNEQESIRTSKELDRRMRIGELALAIEIPEGFGRYLRRGTFTQAAAWVDGTNPFRAETIRGYTQRLHERFLKELAAERGTVESLPVDVETRFFYNEDFQSVAAMVPGVIGFLLIVIPALLTALGVVREKELGSITNLYVTPVTRLEFLLGKQLPYILLAMINYAVLVLMAVTIFGVPFKGSLAALTLAALLYVTAATGIGILVSSFTNSQIAALFAAGILTLLPATNFSGLIDPVHSLQGPARFIGEHYPTTYFIEASVGAFSKGLGLSGLLPFIQVLAVMAPLFTLLGLLFLRKQER